MAADQTVVAADADGVEHASGAPLSSGPFTTIGNICQDCVIDPIYCCVK